MAVVSVELAEQLAKALASGMAATAAGRLREHLTEQIGPERAEAVLWAIDKVQAEYQRLFLERDDGISRQDRVHMLLKQVDQAEFSDLRGFGIPDGSSASVAAQNLLAWTDGAAGPFGVPEEIVEGIMENPYAKPFFDREPNAEEDRRVFAALAETVIRFIDSRRDKKISSSEAAAITIGVRTAVSTAKTVYKVGAGKISVLDGKMAIQDHAEAGLRAAILAGSAVAGGLAGATAGGFLGAYIGMAPIGVVVGGELGRMGGTAIGGPLGDGAVALARLGVKTVQETGTQKVRIFEELLGNP